MSTPKPGDTVLDRYVVLGEIGQGGMQIVYLATDQTFNREVVLKVPKNASAARRFRDSAVLSATVNHPNVAATLDYFEQAGGEFFLIEEYVDGEDLKKVAARFQRLDPYTVAYVVHHLARAVSASHHVNVVHRDLKPSNIMIGGGLAFNALKVTDFGIAKMAAHEVKEHVGTDDESTAKSSTVMNALAYMAPEVINSPHKVKKAADVWAMCAIGWDLLAGAPPFGAGLLAVNRIVSGPAPTLDATISAHRHFGPLSAQIAGLLLKGMDQNASKRPTADRLAELFDEVCYLKPVRKTGTVKNWWGRTWGFIASDAKNDVFFHGQSVVGVRPKVGDPVWFSRFPGDPHDRAVPVVPLRT